jgi:hypothetical protein
LPSNDGMSKRHPRQRWRAWRRDNAIDMVRGTEPSLEPFLACGRRNTYCRYQAGPEGNDTTRLRHVLNMQRPLIRIRGINLGHECISADNTINFCRARPIFNHAVTNSRFASVYRAGGDALTSCVCLSKPPFSDWHWDGVSWCRACGSDRV